MEAAAPAQGAAGELAQEASHLCDVLTEYGTGQGEQDCGEAGS